MYLTQWLRKMEIYHACAAPHIKSKALRLVLALIAFSSFTFYLIATPAREFIRSRVARVKVLRWR